MTMTMTGVSKSFIPYASCTSSILYNYVCFFFEHIIVNYAGIFKSFLYDVKLCLLKSIIRVFLGHVTVIA